MLLLHVVLTFPSNRSEPARRGWPMAFAWAGLLFRAPPRPAVKPRSRALPGLSAEPAAHGRSPTAQRHAVGNRRGRSSLVASPHDRGRPGAALAQRERAALRRVLAPMLWGAVLLALADAYMVDHRPGGRRAAGDVVVLRVRPVPGRPARRHAAHAPASVGGRRPRRRTRFDTRAGDAARSARAHARRPIPATRLLAARPRRLRRRGRFTRRAARRRAATRVRAAARR